MKYGHNPLFFSRVVASNVFAEYSDVIVKSTFDILYRKRHNVILLNLTVICCQIQSYRNPPPKQNKQNKNKKNSHNNLWSPSSNKYLGPSWIPCIHQKGI